MKRQGVREVLLIGIIGPFPERDAGAVLFCDRGGGIGAFGVHHHDIIGHALERSQATGDVTFLIEGDDDGRDPIHGAEATAMDERRSAATNAKRAIGIPEGALCI